MGDAVLWGVLPGRVEATALHVSERSPASPPLSGQRVCGVKHRPRKEGGRGSSVPVGREGTPPQKERDERSGAA